MIKKFRIYFLAIILLMGIFGGTTAFAKESAVVPLEVVNKGIISEINKDEFKNSIPLELENVQSVEVQQYEIFVEVPEALKAPAERTDIMLLSSGVAEMRIFADTEGESSFSTDGHAFLTIKNISTSNITVGGLIVAPSKTVTVGTWGKFSEHRGLWYNLEGYAVHVAGTDYSNSVSMKVVLSQSLLETVSTNIRNGDSWLAVTNNCSSFATRIWNSVCSDKISAGTPNTPTTTYNSIKAYGTSYYRVGASIPYDYVVYYGQPATRSTDFT